MKGRLPLLIALGAAAGGTGVAISNRTPVIKSGYIAPSAILPAEAFSKESLTDALRSGRHIVKAPTRQEQLDRLEHGDFDVLVLGGGVTGASIALEAATRGLKVALVEKNDFASGTSSRSTKLIHGGVRYLEQAVKTLDPSMLGMVTEALRERSHVLNSAEYMNSPLPIVVPLYSYWEIPYMYVGLKMYELLAGFASKVPPSRLVSREEIKQNFPLLSQEGLKGGVLYYDGQMNDARYTLALALTAQTLGATVANYVGVTGLNKVEVPVNLLKKNPDSNATERVSAKAKDVTNVADNKEGDSILVQEIDPETESRVAGATVVDGLTGRSFRVKAKSVINATGAFSDSVRRMDNPDAPSLVIPSVGVHVVLPGDLVPSSQGLLVPKTPDGRVLFALPWEGRTIIGTTDSESPITELPTAKQQDVSFILETLNMYYTKALSIKDVQSVWAGLRPLVRDPVAAAKGITGTKSLSRHHVITTSPSGLVSVMGGKFTTCRQMAEEAVDAAVETLPPALLTELPMATLSRTRGMVIHGSDASGVVCERNYSKLASNLANHHPLIPRQTIDHIVKNYGIHAVHALAIALNPTPAMVEASKLLPPSAVISTTPSPSADTITVAPSLPPLTAGASTPSAETTQSWGSYLLSWLNPASYISSSSSKATSPPSSSPADHGIYYLAPNHPYLLAEVEYAIQREGAQHIDDVLCRRTRLAFVDSAAARRAIPAVSRIMKEDLGWSAQRTKEEEERAIRVLDSMDPERVV